MSEPISDLQLHISKQLLRYAVSRAIFCPTCKGVLDVRRAVLAETSALAVIECASCWESTVEGMRERLGADRTDEVLADIDVTDGRELHSRAHSKPNRVVG